MGGLLFGPAIGAWGAALVGGHGFVFVFCGVASVLAALAVAVRVREEPHGRHGHPVDGHAATEFPPEGPHHRPVASPAGAPASLWNRGLVAALVLNAGGYFASGTYEVIWSLFLKGLGAGLDLIGLTFSMFGLPILLLSTYAGRLVDRRGPFWFLVFGSIAPAVSGIAYTLIVDPGFAVPLILLEATGFAFLNPALFTIVGANSPAGRSSTAQGLFGAAGTVGFIVASLVAGALAEVDIRFPFYLFTAVILTTLAVALAVGWGPFRRRPAAGTTAPAG
jgi:MFS family permease